MTTETLALSDAIDDGIYISELISKLVFNGVKHIPTEICTDSKSLYDAMKPKKNITEKRLRTEIAILRELLELKIVNKLHYIDTRFSLANALTNKGGFFVVFLSRFSFTTIHESQDCRGRGRAFFNSSLPLPPASQTLRH